MARWSLRAPTGRLFSSLLFVLTVAGIGAVAGVMAGAVAGCGPSDAGGGPPDARGSVLPDAALPDGPEPDAPIDAAFCTPEPDGEKCNGRDDDCDGQADEGFPGVGLECDVGVGACERTGTTVCSQDGTTVVCDALPGPPGPAELCGNLIDDDCNGQVDEGYDLAGPCDGPDADACADGTKQCSADRLSIVCVETGPTKTEICDGLDNDCDTLKDEDFLVGQACDGNDADRCAEGVWTCNGLMAAVCNDFSGNNADLCNAIDDDCDPATPNGVDQCVAYHGSNTCNGAVCVPSCDFGWQSCDGNPDNGCESLRNTNPSCPTFTALSPISGDGGSVIRTLTGFGEVWAQIRITENNGSISSEDLWAYVELIPPAGADFDLCVFCDGCGNGNVTCSTSRGAGLIERVNLYNDDDQGLGGIDDSFNVVAQVIFVSASPEACDNWTLKFVGDASWAGAAQRTCD